MTEPKEFYRKLDSLLRRIGKGKTGKDFLCSIVTELENSFGNDLKISHGRIYEEGADGFVLLDSDICPPVAGAAEAIPNDTEAVQSVLKFGSYIYDNPDFTIDPQINKQGGYAIAAAFTITRGFDERWLFVFELNDDWVREEIEFCLNAVRAALNYRIRAEAINSDLEQAAQIQKSLLPSNLPQIKGYEFAARSQPAELVGGDLYDFFHFSDNIFGVSVGDASGHGLPAALLVRDVVTGLRMGMEEQLKMVHTLRKLNRVIYRSTFSTRFVSLFYGEIETNGNLLYANAGHPAPLLVHGDKVKEIKATGMILGAIQDLPLQRSYAHIKPNSLLVMYSDGIIERQSSKRNDFGINRLKAFIKTHQEKSAQEIIDLIFDAVFEFGDNEKWEDDATIVVIKRLSEEFL